MAAPWGSDRAPGTARRPFRSIPRLLGALGSGRTGCLRRGGYPGDVTVRRGGRDRAPLVLRNWPGETARVIGRLVVARGADHVTIRGLWLDGRNPSDLPSPTVLATGARFVRNDVTNRNTSICFALGNPSFGEANDTLLQRNRIHHCGRLPPTNHHHGIYVEQSRHARIVGNWIHDNADRGIQLYPDAQRTFIGGNVIAGNGQGVIFSGEAGLASNENVVEGNVIADSRVRHNVESYYPPGNPIGSGNVVRLNCVGGGVEDFGGGGIQDPALGFVAIENLLVRPLFRNAARGDLRVRAPRACAPLVARWGRPGPGTRPPRQWRTVMGVGHRR